MTIHWYPGHMAKAKREMQEHLKLVDLCIQVLDARAPIATQNPDLKQMFENKPIITVLNKSDLADDTATKQWVEYLKKDGEVLAYSATQKHAVKPLLNAIDRASLPIVERYKKRGANKVIRSMVVGIPNVGKSSLINSLAKSSRAKTGARPGLTRGRQWVKLSPYLELMDTPGVLWPKLHDQQAAMHLAYTYAIKDEVLDQHAISISLVNKLIKENPKGLEERYQLQIAPDMLLKPKNVMGEELFAAIAEKRGLLKQGGEIDIDRAQRLLLDEFREGKLGKVTLEMPGDEG